MRIPILFITLLFSNYCLALSQDEWDKISSHDMDSKPYGIEYQMKFAQYTAMTQGPIDAECSGDKIPDYFAVYLKINSTGVIIESIVFPSNQTSQCYLKKMQSLKYPPPPFAPFHFKIGMFDDPDSFNGGF